MPQPEKRDLGHAFPMSDKATVTHVRKTEQGEPIAKETHEPDKFSLKCMRCGNPLELIEIYMCPDCKERYVKQHINGLGDVFVPIGKDVER